VLGPLVGPLSKPNDTIAGFFEQPISERKAPMTRINLIPILPFLLIAIACGRFQAGTIQTERDRIANASPPAVVKAVDLLSLAGKSKEQVKQLVTGGRLSNEFSDSLSFNFPQAELQVFFKKSAADRITYRLPLVSDPLSGSRWLGETPERLGEHVGIDLKGKTPSKSFDFARYYDVGTAGGKNISISLTPIESGAELFYEIVLSGE
jgi:hypothetical protein